VKVQWSYYHKGYFDTMKIITIKNHENF